MAAVTARKLARLLVLLLLLAGLGLVLFLATLDLNRYRTDIAGALSELFERPVHFSSIAFSLENGLALDLRDLDIPAQPGRADQLTTRHLYLKVRLLPLISGRISLRKVIIDQPDLTIDLASPRADEKKAPPSPDGQSRLVRTGVQEVRIRQGQIRLLLPGQSDRPLQLGAADLAVAAASGNRLRLELNGRLLRDTFQCPVRLTGTIIGDSPAEWTVQPVDLSLVLSRFPLDALGQDLPKKLPRPAGSAEIQTRLTGDLDSGYQVSLHLTGQEARLTWRDRPPLALDGLTLQSIWHPATGTQRLDDLELRLPQGHLKGALRSTDGRLAGDVRLDVDDLARLAGWLPDRLQLTSGRLGASLHLAPTSPNAAPKTWIAHLTGGLSLTGLAGRWNELPPVTEGLVRAGLEQGTVTLNEARFQLWDQLQSLSGRMRWQKDALQLALTAGLKLPLERVAARRQPPAGLEVSGLAVLQARITGDSR
ncbi:MAG: hypothetical protein D6790_04810, partial [Caldilineae bacterium]